MDDAEYPSELDAYLTLPNRSCLRIRALRRGDQQSIRELDAHLSTDTRYLGFFSPMPALPDSVMRLLASVDYRRRLALVAEHEDTNGGAVVGLGIFGAVDDRRAEVALVVRDEWQRRRVGTELAIRVLEAAEARGFHRFIAHVLPGNVAIRKLLRNVAHVISSKVSGGVSELEFVRRSRRSEII